MALNFMLAVPMPIILFLLFMQFHGLHSELGEWKFESGEFRPSDGACILNDRILVLRNPPAPASPYCTHPKYELIKFCARKHFYTEEEGGTSGNLPKAQYNNSALYLLNGCLQCPFGNAQAEMRLLNRLQSGALFSGCGGEEEIVVSSTTVHLTESGRAQSESHGQFAMGGILTGRECGIFSKEREKEFRGVVVEVKHNCGRKKPMILRVEMPPVLVDLIRDRGNFREWDGLSLNLGIYGVGWDERWVDFGHVRPSDFRRHQQMQGKKRPPIGEHRQIVEVQPRSGKIEGIRHYFAGEKPMALILPTAQNQRQQPEEKATEKTAKNMENVENANANGKQANGEEGGKSMENAATVSKGNANTIFDYFVPLVMALTLLFCILLCCCLRCCCYPECCGKKQRKIGNMDWQNNTKIEIARRFGMEQQQKQEEE